MIDPSTVDFDKIDSFNLNSNKKNIAFPILFGLIIITAGIYIINQNSNENEN